MSTFAITDYKLRIVNDLEELEVVDRSTNLVEVSYDLTDPLKISVSSGNYNLTEDTCGTCFAILYDPGQADSVTFDNEKMIGTTMVRIECRHIYSYYLDECPVYLKYENNKLSVKGPSNIGGTAPCEECVDFDTEGTGCA